MVWGLAGGRAVAECLTSYRKSQCVAGPCWPSVPSPCVGVMAGHEDPAVRQQQPASHGWSWNNTTRSGQGRTSFITWTDTHWEYLSTTQSLCNSCLLSECCLNICVKLITNYPADCQQFLMIGLLSSREPSLYCRTHTSLTHSRQMVVKTAALTAVRAVFTTSNRDSAQSSPLSQ